MKMKRVEKARKERERRVEVGGGLCRFRATLSIIDNILSSFLSHDILVIYYTYFSGFFFSLSVSVFYL